MLTRHLPYVLLIATTLAACSSHPSDPRGESISAVFKQVDADGDERLTPQEFAQLPLQGVKFEDVDSDNNGVVTIAELRSYLEWRRITSPTRQINLEPPKHGKADDSKP